MNKENDKPTGADIAMKMLEQLANANNPSEHAEIIAKAKINLSEVQESTQKIEDNFSDMMPTAEEFWYDAQPEAYEPSCYDGTYSEM
tara:strand:+ start:21 stop:281 length:261 start_codon:yes stop_codon:yes gene_type:complete